MAAATGEEEETRIGVEERDWWGRGREVLKWGRERGSRKGEARVEDTQLVGPGSNKDMHGVRRSE